MPPLSAVIITQDEAQRVGAAVASARPWVDEVLVVDGGSRDRTAQVAGNAGARVVERRFDGFVAQKRAAVAAARHDHVVLLDADERIDPLLGAALVTASWEVVGYRVHRLNYLDGAPVRRSGWGGDRPLRVFDRRRAELVGREPHDRVEVDGPVGRLGGHLHHDVDRDTRAYVRATVAHARRAAAAIASEGRPGPADAWLHAGVHFARKVLQGAPLDGRRGMTVAWVGAKGVERKYRLARRLAR